MKSVMFALVVWLLWPGDTLAFRDPFHMPVIHPGKVRDVPRKTVVKEEIPKLNLTAIMQHSGENAALINGRIVRKNDTFGGVEILDIQSDYVEVEYKKKQYRLELR